MNGVEAAASLFGPEEPASDPFAALGESQSFQDDPFLVTGASSSATSQHSDALDVENTAAPPPAQEYTQQGLENSNFTVGGYAEDSGTGNQQGWYNKSAYPVSEHALNGMVLLVETTPPFSYQSRRYPTEPVSQRNDATSSVQDPYAQPSNFGTAANALDSVHYSLAQPVQDYKPPAAYSDSMYSYSTSSSQPSGSQYTPSYPAPSQTLYIQPSIDSKSPVPLSVPPPAPPPVEAINRPKISNAYDPPFPTMTKSRRGVTSRTGLSQTHSGYVAYQPLPPPATLEGPFAPPSAPQPPPLHNDAEQTGMRPPSEWGYTNHGIYLSGKDTVIPAFGGPPADPASMEGFREQINSYGGVVDVHPSVVAPSGNVESHTPDYTFPIPPTMNQAQDLYYPASPSQPPAATSFRSSSPRNLSTPLAYDHSMPSMPHVQAKIPTTGPNGFETESLDSGQNGVQATTSDSFNLDSVCFEDQQAGLNDMYLAAEAAPSSIPTAINEQSCDPYAPESHLNGSYREQTSSPNSIRSWTGTSGKPYPSVNHHSPPRADVLRNRSMSNGPTTSPMSTSVKDPYAPAQHPRRQKSETDYGSYGYQRGQDLAQTYPSAIMVDHHPVQELAKPFHTPYAPSPSLLGANDPLGRTAARIPVFSFGFGGKFVTCFHGAASLNTGFDVALSSRNSTGVHIRVLKQLIPESALDTSTVVFPGPLFSDPGSLTSLVRTGASSHTKAKKVQVVKYLGERAEELALGLRYLSPDSIEQRRTEGKLVLIKLLKVMVEHDGRLTGT